MEEILKNLRRQKAEEKNGILAQTLEGTTFEELFYGFSGRKGLFDEREEVLRELSGAVRELVSA